MIVTSNANGFAKRILLATGIASQFPSGFRIAERFALLPYWNGFAKRILLVTGIASQFLLYKAGICFANPIALAKLIGAFGPFIALLTASNIACFASQSFGNITSIC